MVFTAQTIHSLSAEDGRRAETPILNIITFRIALSVAIILQDLCTYEQNFQSFNKVTITLKQNISLEIIIKCLQAK
jgi:hypothetical protein